MKRVKDHEKINTIKHVLFPEYTTNTHSNNSSSAFQDRPWNSKPNNEVLDSKDQFLNYKPAKKIADLNNRPGISPDKNLLEKDGAYNPFIERMMIQRSNEEKLRSNSVEPDKRQVKCNVNNKMNARASDTYNSQIFDNDNNTSHLKKFGLQGKKRVDIQSQGFSKEALIRPIKDESLVGNYQNLNDIHKLKKSEAINSSLVRTSKHVLSNNSYKSK